MKLVIDGNKWKNGKTGYFIFAEEELKLIELKIEDVYFTPKVYRYFNPKVYHFKLISKSVSLLLAVPPTTGKQAFLF